MTRQRIYTREQKDRHNELVRKRIAEMTPEENLAFRAKRNEQHRNWYAGLPKHKKTEQANKNNVQLKINRISGKLSIKAIVYERLSNRGATYEQIQAAVNKFKSHDGLCVYCGTPTTFNSGHIDHIIPVAKGGSHDPENLQIVCSSCNRAKGTKSHDEFYAWMINKKLSRGIL